MIGDENYYVANEERIARLVRIMTDHFHGTESDSKQYSAALLARAFNSEPFLYNRSRDIETLDRVHSALLEVERALNCPLSSAALETLACQIVRGPHYEKAREEAVYSWTDEGREAIRYAEENGAPAYSSLDSIRQHASSIRAAIKSTKSEILTSPDARRSTATMNLEGVQFVEAARMVWKDAKGKDAPSKALNPGSPFAYFLADVFEACEISGDHRSAFAAWARESSRGT